MTQYRIRSAVAFCVLLYHNLPVQAFDATMSEVSGITAEISESVMVVDSFADLRIPVRLANDTIVAFPDGGETTVAALRTLLQQVCADGQSGLLVDVTLRGDLDAGAARITLKGVAVPDAGTITETQAALSRIGFDAGSADGVLGKKTVSAIIQFKGANGMHPSGCLTSQVHAKARDLAASSSRTLVQSGGEKAVVGTPLHDAAKNGNEAELARLLSEGADHNALDTAGYTPLAYAAATGQAGAAALLLNAGGTVTDNRPEASYASPALYMACGNGHLDLVKLLVEHGAPVNWAERSGGGTLLHIVAAMSGSVEIAKYLVANGADPHAKDKNGHTAAFIAERLGRGDLAHFLSSLDNSPHPTAPSIKSSSKGDAGPVATGGVVHCRDPEGAFEEADLIMTCKEKCGGGGGRVVGGKVVVVGSCFQDCIKAGICN